jgi:CheY-like chemotaxis protein
MLGVGELPVLSQDGSVLVVEDEHLLRQAVVKMLRKNGFKVFEASDGSSAIDLLHANQARIDAILLDMTIPGASCQEIIAEAANATPDIRVKWDIHFTQVAPTYCGPHFQPWRNT